MPLPLGIDISSHQGSNLNFALMRAITAFVAIRSGISWGYKDPQFDANWAGVYGHNRIAYHVIYPSQDAKRQCDWMLSIVQPGENDRLALDMELATGLGKVAITDMFLTCIDYLKAKTGRYPILYSRANWINDYMQIERLPLTLDMWLANYLTALPSPAFTPEKDPPPFMPRNWNGSWLIHQTAERGDGSLYGVKSYYVDLDRWNGTRDDVDAYFGKRKWYQFIPFIRKPIVNPNAITPATKTLTIKPAQLDVPAYSQKDARWRYDRMGATWITMEQEGCLDTITAAGLTALGYGITPGEYNYAASIFGGYAEVKDPETGKVTKTNRMLFKFPDILTNGEIVRAEYRDIFNNRGWQELADSILADKRPVWAEVKLNGNQHWVLIVGKNAGDYWALDPWTGEVGKFEYPAVYRIVSYRRVK